MPDIYPQFSAQVTNDFSPLASSHQQTLLQVPGHSENTRRFLQGNMFKVKTCANKPLNYLSATRAG
jgi:hypothetical protein